VTDREKAVVTGTGQEPNDDDMFDKLRNKTQVPGRSTGVDM